MAETKAKIWLANDKKNFVEVTATDNNIVMDVYKTKKLLIKHYCKILKHIVFTKAPKIKDKQELAQAAHGFIDQYYEEKEADKMKKQVLEDLELVEKEKRDISYIG